MIGMESVTISPKFQVVIPLAIRRQLGLKAGQKLSVVAMGNVVRLFPVTKPSSYRGIAKRVDPAIQRESDRKL
jgi:AbrB family looped-hinge helix DNA binding protein